MNGHLRAYSLWREICGMFLKVCLAVHHPLLHLAAMETQVLVRRFANLIAICLLIAVAHLHTNRPLILRRD